MSFERAYKACKMCFEYTKLMDKEGICGAGMMTVFGNKKIRETVVFEAMKALEAVEGDVAKEALKACANCDYKSPRIANLIGDGMSEKSYDA